MSEKNYRFNEQHQFSGNLIGGEFSISDDPSGEWNVESPADLDERVSTIQYSYADVDRAVEAAHQAFQTWRLTSWDERASLLKKFAEVVRRREEEFTEIISREVGKPLWESKTEVGAMVGKVGITLEETPKLIADKEFPEIAAATHGAYRFRPFGVMAVIGPFNFPGHLPNGHIVPALLTGNTVVFKPSEKTPLTGQLLAECFHEAGFPPGVVNLLQGEKEVSRRLCTHEGVAGVLFTGSYEVGTRIKQDTLQQHWKILALEMGGKNSAIVWNDASLEAALRETLVGAFITTGQRCSGTSRIIVHESLMDEFTEKFHERSKAFTIGHPLEDPFMGPVIDGTSRDRYLKFHGIAKREGGELVMRGKALDLDKRGYYVSPTIARFDHLDIEQSRKSVYQQTEIFAPGVSIIKVREIEEAIAQANVTQYGLSASVFSQSKEVYQKFWDGLEAGLINWNKMTCGASSKLPFGGLKKSGNHQPTALFAPYYCTYPVASLESSDPPGGGGSYPGLNWS